jgi:hypothetical protein
MVDAYLAWRLEVGKDELDQAAPPVSVAGNNPDGGLKIQVLDMFRELNLSPQILYHVF